MLLNVISKLFSLLFRDILSARIVNNNSGSGSELEVDVDASDVGIDVLVGMALDSLVSSLVEVETSLLAGSLVTSEVESEVGIDDGTLVGIEVGSEVGADVTSLVGILVGEDESSLVGMLVGSLLGSLVGPDVVTPLSDVGWLVGDSPEQLQEDNAKNDENINSKTNFLLVLR